MSESKQHEYRIYHIAIDMANVTDGDFEDFRRHLDELERDIVGVHLLGTDTTRSWPTIRVTDNHEPGVPPTRDVGEVMQAYLRGVPCICGHSSSVHSIGRPGKDLRPCSDCACGNFQRASTGGPHEHD